MSALSLERLCTKRYGANGCYQWVRLTVGNCERSVTRCTVCDTQQAAQSVTDYQLIVLFFFIFIFLDKLSSTSASSSTAVCGPPDLGWEGAVGWKGWWWWCRREIKHGRLMRTRSGLSVCVFVLPIGAWSLYANSCAKGKIGNPKGGTRNGKPIIWDKIVTTNQTSSARAS